MGRLQVEDFEQLRQRHGWDCRVYIETGLWKGVQLAIAAPLFDVVHGIELDEHWAAVSAERTRNFPHVTVHHGDTREVLPRLLKQYEGISCFINIDAHFCKTNPPIQRSEFPLWSELAAIRDHSGSDIVNVDDVKVFGQARPDLRYRDDAIEWEGVTTTTLTDFFQGQIVDSLVVNDGFVFWRRPSK